MKKFLILSLIATGAMSFAFVAKPEADAMGTLVVKIEMPDDKKKADADVDLALSKKQLINMDFVASAVTDKAGIATFRLAAGTYYIGVTQAVVTQVYTNRELSATITAGKKTKVTIPLAYDN